MHSLSRLTLGADFSFVGAGNAVALPAVPSNAAYAGVWQNVGSGTMEDPQGIRHGNSLWLVTNYDGSTMAGTWVWQRRG